MVELNYKENQENISIRMIDMESLDEIREETSQNALVSFKKSIKASFENESEIRYERSKK